MLSLLLASLLLSTNCIAQSTTIRIRFANGRNGKPLKLKFYESGIVAGFSAGNYKIDRVESDSLIVTFTDVSTFQFRSAGFEPCDVKRKHDKQPQYVLKEIVSQGVVAPNFCGSTSGRAVPGELLIYSRHERWWELSKRIVQGLLICG